MGVAYADIFGDRPQDIIKTGPAPQKLSTKLEATQNATLAIPMPTLLGLISEWMNSLGTREGMIYDITNQKVLNYVGATIYTKYDVAWDVGLIEDDGVGTSLDYNCGTLIKNVVNDIPIVRYLQYLYVGAGYGYRSGSESSESNLKNNLFFVGAQFKTTF